MTIRPSTAAFEQLKNNAESNDEYRRHAAETDTSPEKQKEYLIRMAHTHAAQHVHPSSIGSRIHVSNWGIIRKEQDALVEAQYVCYLHPWEHRFEYTMPVVNDNYAESTMVRMRLRSIADQGVVSDLETVVAFTSNDDLRIVCGDHEVEYSPDEDSEWSEIISLMRELGTTTFDNSYGSTVSLPRET